MDLPLIAGLWLDASAWDAVVGPLGSLGHRAVPVGLPGQGDGATTATLDDQVAAVVAAVDAAPDPVVVVGHSAACSLAWAATDARPDRVAKVVMIGGFPSGDGCPYFEGLPVVDGAVPFPGWEEFEGPDSADLDAEVKQRIASAAIPVPETVTTGILHLSDERRYRVPVVLVCPEFSASQARGWLEDGQIPELAHARRVDYVDLDSGHWPMFSCPEELARVLAEIADAG